MKLSDFDYNLPEELIAQFPLKKRESSRMLVLEGKTVAHKGFEDFINYLNADDILVLNNTKVIPARLLGKRETGGEVEIFLARPLATANEPKWQALIKRSKRLKDGEIIEISPKLSVKIADKEQGIVELLATDIYKAIEEYGQIPLPPYISRRVEKQDEHTYQTVYAKELGSSAAPTAGLHFSEKILADIAKKGVKIAYITLEVGLGTFLPVKCENILEHKMHPERFSISQEAADAINTRSGRLVAVGTTVTRTLEATMAKHGKIVATRDETDIFIYPPYEFKAVDALLTNFHLPKSTLLMLISAFRGHKTVLSAYAEAVHQKYRFFSYGDCMLLL
jgi:S-adenosylmethionine:tRNA ribosyltransferase-isomerase